MILLRTTGQRTLSKLSAFDFIITVAIGSTLASFVLSSGTTVVDGITAIAVLVGLQFVISWLTVRSDVVKKAVKNEPELLYYKGDYLTGNMKKARVVREEVQQSIRSNGYSSAEDVDAVILETDGSFSIIGKVSSEDGRIPDVVKVKKSG